MQAWSPSAGLSMLGGLLLQQPEHCPAISRRPGQPGRSYCMRRIALAAWLAAPYLYCCIRGPSVRLPQRCIWNGGPSRPPARRCYLRHDAGPLLGFSSGARCAAWMSAAQPPIPPPSPLPRSRLAPCLVPLGPTGISQTLNRHPTLSTSGIDRDGTLSAPQIPVAKVG